MTIELRIYNYTSNSEHMRIHAIEDGRILPSRKGMLGGV